MSDKDKIDFIQHVRRTVAIAKDIVAKDTKEGVSFRSLDIISNWANLDDEHILEQWDMFDDICEKYGPEVTTLVHGW